MYYLLPLASSLCYNNSVLLALLFLSALCFPLLEADAREVLGDFLYNKDSCWDRDVIDYLGSAADCQLYCTFDPGCNTWGYYHSGSYRCHLCSWNSPRANVPCSNEGSTSSDPCSTWGRRINNFNIVTFLNSAIDQAAKVCNGTLNPDDALVAATELHHVVNKYADGEFDSDASFLNNLSSAADQAARILKVGDGTACYNAYTGPTHRCKYGSLVHHQLRALLLYVDGNAKRAFPMKRNLFRRKLFNHHKVFLADNGWMSKFTQKKLITFFSQLPIHLKKEGLWYNAKFSTQSVEDAYMCKGFYPGLLSTSKGGAHNVFKLQVGQSDEQAFPDDTPDIPPPMDLQLTVTRHEVSHQFDRIIENRASQGDSRLLDMKIALMQAGAGSDNHWLRSFDGAAFFFSEDAPQEIIASQVGNQYLGTTSSQLRLGAYRLKQNEGWIKPTYSVVTEGVATLTRNGQECLSQTKDLGDIATAQDCVDIAMTDPSCSYEIMWSGYTPYGWGCSCCTAHEDLTCPTKETMYEDQPLWDVYQYKNTSKEPTCGNTGVPMSWFLFNVDIFTPVGSSVATFFENEQNGEVITVQVAITRDSSTRINSLKIPFCGLVTIGYDNNGIVNSVSDNAITCVFSCQNDVNWKFKLNTGKKKGCFWVAQKPRQRCKKIGIDGRKASEVCLQSCNKCTSTKSSS